MNNERQKPVHEIRLGLVRASIWENKSEYGVRFNVTLERLYSVKLDDNRRQWKSTSSFGRDDLLVAAKVLANEGQLSKAEGALRDVIAAADQHRRPHLMAEAIRDLALVLRQAGRTQEAEALLERAIQLEPDTPDILFWRLGDVYFQKGEYRRVIQVVGKMRDPGEGARLLASAYAHLDMLDEAYRWRDEVLRRQPGFTVSGWMDTQPDALEDDRERFRIGLLRAGLPP